MTIKTMVCLEAKDLEEAMQKFVEFLRMLDSMEVTIEEE